LEADVAQQKRALWQLSVTSYKGLFARCAPGTHEAVIALLNDRAITPRPILDLAAGTGAFLSRIQDHGFTDLNAVELDIPAFGLPGVTPVAVDLNGPFATAFSRQFELITAVEIIEHLDCPRHFLREIWKLLASSGHVVVSTPNITHWMGRIWFLTRGGK
jgi:2-polyprenyl-3-methyl-5-hydroxy-6-metoxy-1,4-benzoquinol methylase